MSSSGEYPGSSPGDKTSPEQEPDGIQRQSLLHRSKKYLGDTVQLDNVAPKPAPSADPESINNNKRREQVRQAQRTHRQRTQNYMKSLEKEVIRLRNSENEAVSRAQVLQGQINVLIATLINHSIEIPAKIAEQQLGLEAALGTFAQVSINPAEPDSVVSVQFSPHETTPGDETEGALSSVTSRSDQFNTHDLRSAAGSHSPVPYSLFQDPRVGIDFVLALEKKCQSHIHKSHLDKDVGFAEITGDEDPMSMVRAGISGHLFTASMTLWQHPGHVPNSERESYEISSAKLNDLIQLSLNIPISPDVMTPVQIWHLLQSVQGPEAAMSMETLKLMTDELEVPTNCLYFGAGINREVAISILRKYLPNSVAGWEGIPSVQ